MTIGKDHIIAAGMAAGGSGAKFGPAQLQKLFFLIDREISDISGGPFFNFTPYDYGPFDKAVYDTANSLIDSGLIEIDHSSRYRQYLLTKDGYVEGQKVLDELDGKAKSFIKDAAEWVRSVSFQEMITSIYKHYPDTKVNSIFR